MTILIFSLNKTKSYINIYKSIKIVTKQQKEFIFQQKDNRFAQLLISSDTTESPEIKFYTNQHRS